VGDDFILRIARNHPKSFSLVYTEKIAVPTARAAGVRTPELLVCDMSLGILPVPYTIYERVRGQALGLLTLDPHATPDTWRAVGRDLARLHHGVSRDGPAAELADEEFPDPRPWAEELAEAGLFTMLEARWLLDWLDRLAPAAQAPIQRQFCHGDGQATNIMVQPDTFDYLALIDWSEAHWADPAHDFGGKPIRAVPYVLEGYRQAAPLEHDETAEARILWRYLWLALHNLWREPQPKHSWAERPLTFLLDLMRFLMEEPSGRWQAWLV
jgi:aminoglycoside phosphotransferase (APT) family kinase protein